jgi:hypothetical protein
MINVDDDEAILDENWSILPQLSKTERGCTVQCSQLVKSGWLIILVDGSANPSRVN